MMMNLIDLPHHIDCTYKLCERGYPLLVFGVSDLVGQFFPIAFAIMSHEQELDFTQFFRTLLEFCKICGVSDKVAYLVQDACGACANAATNCLGPNMKILMCFFHVMKNVKERLKCVDEAVKHGIVKDINYLHFCKNEFEFTLAKHNIYNKWQTLLYE